MHSYFKTPCSVHHVVAVWGKKT